MNTIGINENLKKFDRNGWRWNRFICFLSSSPHAVLLRSSLLLSWCLGDLRKATVGSKIQLCGAQPWRLSFLKPRRAGEDQTRGRKVREGCRREVVTKSLQGGGA